MKFPVAILLMALASTAHAGLTVTEKSAGWRVLPAKTADDPVLKDIAACREAVKLRGPGDYTCEYVTSISVTATCDDEPMPVMPTIVTPEGFITRPGIVGTPLPDGSAIAPTMEEGYVKGSWKYPDCWVPGLVPYDGKFRAPDGPNDTSPSPFVYGYDEEWPVGKPCPSADPRMCYVAPNHPSPPPARAP